MPFMSSKHRLVFVGLALLASLPAGGCGGGGGGGNNSKSLRLEAAFDRSGQLYDDGQYFTLPASNVLAPGDDMNNRVLRSLVSILLAPIPSGATIDSATLDLE